MCCLLVYCTYIKYTPGRNNFFMRIHKHAKRQKQNKKCSEDTAYTVQGVPKNPKTIERIVRI